MRHVLTLMYWYVRYHWLKTFLLLIAVTIVLSVPTSLVIIFNQASTRMLERSRLTPLLLGRKGSTIDLTMSSLYFQKHPAESLTYQELETLLNSNLAQAIPLHIRYHVEEQPIVGTTLDYFSYREYKLQEGRWFGMLGECVLGAEAAKNLELKTGDYVFSSAGNAFDVAGAFPLKMKISGILARSQTPDDVAVFIDIKTSWVIAGLAHGHDDMQNVDKDTLLSQSSNNKVANATVLSYTEITPSNVSSFHFHGDISKFPLDSLLVIPHSRKKGILLRGKIQDDDEIQLIVPTQVIEELIGVLMKVKTYALLGSACVGFASMITIGLVFALSIKNRKREILTLNRIGGSKRRTRGIVSLEIMVISLGACILTFLWAITLSLSDKWLLSLLNIFT